jgi:parallel beta-helix repeat protein
MFPLIMSIALAVLTAFFSPSPGWSATYYVDRNNTASNDTNPGTETQPWRTIQRAANVMVAGDTTYVKNGTYNEAVSIARSGTSAARIAFVAYPGHKPVVDGTGKVPSWRGCFYAGDTSKGYDYVTIDGFELKNSAYYGIRATGSRYWIVRNCSIHDDAKGGILFDSTDGAVISHNDVYATGWNGISIMGGGNSTVEYNRSYNNLSHSGINIITNHTIGDVAFYYNNVVRYNIVYRNYHGLYARNQINMKIYGNLFYDNDQNGGYAGIFLHYGDGTSSNFVSNSSVYNNTIVGQPYGIVNQAFQYVTIKDNIIYYPTTGPLRLTVANQTVDYNIYYGKDYSSKGPHDRYVDPQFVDPAAKNFNLKSTSPALGTGEGGVNVGAYPLPVAGPGTGSTGGTGGDTGGTGGTGGGTGGTGDNTTTTIKNPKSPANLGIKKLY